MVFLVFMPQCHLLSPFASHTLVKLFINKPVFPIQRYINKPLSGFVSQHSGKSYVLLKNCKSPLLLPIAEIKNTLLPPWHPLLIFKGECTCSLRYGICVCYQMECHCHCRHPETPIIKRHANLRYLELNHFSWLQSFLFLNPLTHLVGLTNSGLQNFLFSNCVIWCAVCY